MRIPASSSTFRPWIADDFVGQARRQLGAAGGTPITWMFLEPEAAAVATTLFRRNGIASTSLSFLEEGSLPVPVHFFLGAYWASRTEPVEDCARRLARCLHRLTEVDPLLSTWLKVGRNRAESLRLRVASSEESLRKLLQQSYDEKFPGLGFRISLWDGRESSGVAMNVTCGSDAAVSPNVVLINLPLPGGEDLRLYQPETVRALFRAVVDEWDPDWAVFASNTMQDMQADRRPYVGWLTYLRTERALISKAQAGIEIASLGNGVLLTAGPNPLQVSDNDIKAAEAQLSTIELS
ncbi:Imm52 family immunity protein [Amycolatopsis pigmentata]|uniref:Imm52 family immunity protein n=1 Tax=Amycolatopsis pigmentata TaxID=450801 RepID=A0ABW5FYG3_9PSEU